MADLTPEEFRRRGYAVVDWVAAYRAGLPDRPVQPDVVPGSVRAGFPAALSEQPEPLDTLLAALDDTVVPASSHWQHPGWFGYFPANASLHSLLGDLLSGGLGAQGMLWSTSPAATEVEQALLDALAGALGLDPAFTFAGGGGGVIQDSASSAALVALLAALHRANPTWRDDGVDGRDRVYVTAETHSSLAKAARVAGLGGRALRTVGFRPGTLTMDPASLAALIAEDRAAGLRPVLVCPTIGTTGTGAMDPVAEIVDAAHGVWVHVDAAWAGVAALCPEHRDLLDGVERTDSFCTDAHKWLGTAFDASLLWVRDARALPDALSITPEYLRNAASDSGTVVDYRDWQVPLGPPVPGPQTVVGAVGLRPCRIARAPARSHRAGRGARRMGGRRTGLRTGRAALARARVPAPRLRRANPRRVGAGQRVGTGVSHAHRRGRASGHPRRDRRGDDGAAARRRAVGAVAQGGIGCLISASGHEYQRQAPAR